jgi:hypothetical protein
MYLSNGTDVFSSDADTATSRDLDPAGFRFSD